MEMRAAGSCTYVVHGFARMLNDAGSVPHARAMRYEFVVLGGAQRRQEEGAPRAPFR